MAALTSTELACTKNEWLGASLTEALVKEFEQIGIDPCGKRGEYHTFVSNGPLFAHPFPIRLGQSMMVPGYHLVDVVV